MLKQRILTALVLLPIVLGALFALERQMFAWVAAVFFLAAGWEWTGLMPRTANWQRMLWLGLLAALMFIAEWFRPLWLMGWMPLWWLVALYFVVRFPDLAQLWHRQSIMSVVGVLLLLPSWGAVVHIQDVGLFGLAGSWALLFILSWVWAADTGAYFTGRAFGRHKLAVHVSPGKTLEGLAGGLVLAMALSVGVAVYLLPHRPSWPVMLMLVCAVVLASVLGDLLESMVKRQKGVKDSGKLLPGHGGMLDRIDSVTAALPIAVMLLLWLGEIQI